MQVFQVFAVIYNEWEDTRVVKVFDTEAKAWAFIDATAEADDRINWEVETWDVD